MCMQLRIRRELRKSRELLWHYLDGETCMFCRKPLLDGQPKNISFGDATAAPLDVELTIHHSDEDHNNNKKSNRAVVHRSCHRRHHALELNGKD